MYTENQEEREGMWESSWLNGDFLEFQEILKMEDLKIIIYQNYKYTCLLRGQYIGQWLIAEDLGLNPSLTTVYTLTV